MSRAIILVADGLGIGSAPDADKFGDVGANTFYHIYQHVVEVEQRQFNIPNLARLGLIAACEQASKQVVSIEQNQDFIGAYGYMEELSSGKDTPSGHWEMTGVPVLFDWGYFHEKANSFPQELIDKLTEKTGVSGILGNKHASGTVILEELGDEHIKTGKPICYTSCDSIFQIAAHEEHFGLDRLYEFCEVARELVDEYNIGRVIARPFLGDNSDNYARTGNRRDYSVLPPSKTILDLMAESGGEVISIGKVSDIFAHQGITQKYKATGLEALINTTLKQIDVARDNSIIFTNLVNFDQDYGHRRDISGFAKALEYFDTRIPEILKSLRDDDVLYITADHGCDPSWPGSEHTREFVPILSYRKGIEPTDLGHRKSFADLGQTIAQQFGLTPMEHGSSFWANVKNNQQ